MNIFIDTQDMEERYGEELYKEYLENQNKELQQRIDKTIDYIKEYGRDKQLEEDYLMSRYNLAIYNTTLLEILGGKENETN